MIGCVDSWRDDERKRSETNPNSASAKKRVATYFMFLDLNNDEKPLHEHGSVQEKSQQNKYRSIIYIAVTRMYVLVLDRVPC